MSVEKLKLIKVTGDREDLNAVVAAASHESGFCVEDAAQILHSTAGYTTINEENPYTAPLNRLAALAQRAGVTLSGKAEPVQEQPESYQDLVGQIEAEITVCQELCERITRAEERLKDDEKILTQLLHMINLDVPLDELFRFRYFKMRFGHMPADNYEALSRYYTESDQYFFFVSEKDKRDVWGLYITLASDAERVDALFETLLFERVIISDRAHGTPRQAHEQLSADLANAKSELAALRAERDAYAGQTADKLRGWHQLLTDLDKQFRLRQRALFSADGFLLCGYAGVREAERVTQNLQNSAPVSISCQDPSPDQPAPPPTRLKNCWFFRPFEEYVKMYGLPNYYEIDPTPLVALTYMLFFGIMFGDVGQGLVIILAGYLMWRLKGMFVGRILTRVGLTSIAFGFFYGSVFGYEDLLPFGFKVNEGANMNTTLVAAVALGAVTISISILMNIINGIRQKDVGKALFSNNGVAALIFYWAVLIAVLLMLNYLPVKLPMALIAAVIVCALAIILMKVPLENLAKHKRKLVPGSFLDYILESFFELFETVLSFVTNTISYIRLGAFALNHVGMMSVVFLLAQTASGTHNPVILIIGNLFIIGFEGMIVCIQALRLEFYEIFGRFYDGTGRAPAQD